MVLAIGDKVEVMNCLHKKYIGKNGTIVFAYKGLPKSQSVGEHETLPKTKRKRELHYRVELNDGTRIRQPLREPQLRKL